MMTPDKNFRMKPQIKTMISMMKASADDRAHFKKMMIDAQLCEEAARRAALKSKDTGAGDGKGRSRGAVAPE